MKRVIIVSLLVCVLALGSIGAAFATGMNFPTTIGALSTGTASVPQVNVTQINPGIDQWGTPIGVNIPVVLDRLWLHFSPDISTIPAGCIWVAVYNASGTCVGTSTTGSWSGTAYRADFATPLPQVSDVYYIRVTVSQPSP